MRILITGGAGFIGSHVADAYLALGHEVLVVDNLSTGSSRHIPNGASFHQADITDAASLKTIFNQFRPEVVSHHAAKISVIDSLENPESDAHVNITGSLNVLQQARDFGTSRFIFSSSGGAIYGQVKVSPVAEDCPPDPLSPYGLSKMAFEKYLTLLYRFGGPVPIILRYANVFGPRQGVQGEAGVISIFSRRLCQDEPCTIFGDGAMTRDYVFVRDVAEANCLALYKGDGGTFNIGTGKQVSTNQLFSALRDLTGKIDQPPHYAPERAGEVLNIALDYRRAEEYLGWKPRTPFNEGLKQVLSTCNETLRVS